MYKNYIFDLYGTLVDINTNEGRKKLWEKLALFYSYNGAVYSYIELKKAYFKEVKKELNANIKTDYPDIDISIVFERLFLNKGIVAEKDLIIQAARLFRIVSTDYIRLYPGVLELLQQLKDSGKKIFMLSNGQRIFTVPELKYLGIHDYFDALYSSSDIGICKPDPAFFQHVIEEQRLDKAESVFIGNDDVCDVEGSKKVGLDCLYIHSNLSRAVEEVASTYEIWDGNIISIIELTNRG